MNHTCIHCQATFRAIRKTKRFCSTKCRVAHARHQELSVTRNGEGAIMPQNDEISRTIALQTALAGAENGSGPVGTESEDQDRQGDFRFHRVNEVTVRVSRTNSDKAVAWIMDVGWARQKHEAWHVRWTDHAARQLCFGPTRLGKAKQFVPLLLDGGFGGAVTMVKNQALHLQRITLEKS